MDIAGEDLVAERKAVERAIISRTTPMFFLFGSTAIYLS